MLWEEMIASPLSEKLLYTCLVICFSGIVSYYYQHIIHLPFNKDIAFGAIDLLRKSLLQVHPVYQCSD